MVMIFPFDYYKGYDEPEEYPKVYMIKRADGTCWPVISARKKEWWW